MVLYADDTTLFVSGKCVQNIQAQLTDDLDAVNQWLNVNGLTLNATKTKTMLSRTQRNVSKVNMGLNLKIGRESLEQVSCFRYLGLWFDGKKHVNGINKQFQQIRSSKL